MKVAFIIFKTGNMTLDDLIQEGQNVLESKWASGFDTYVDSDIYEIWRRKSLMFLQEYYPTHPQVKDYEEIKQDGH